MVWLPLCFLIIKIKQQPRRQAQDQQKFQPQNKSSCLILVLSKNTNCEKAWPLELESLLERRTHTGTPPPPTSAWRDCNISRVKKGAYVQLRPFSDRLLPYVLAFSDPFLQVLGAGC